jgi:hypothetical protein
LSFATAADNVTEFVGSTVEAVAVTVTVIGREVGGVVVLVDLEPPPQPIRDKDATIPRTQRTNLFENT